MESKQYIYIGEHYDITGRELNITDKKIGLTINPEQRESNWSKTKSPILYRHIKVYEVDDMYKVEKMLHSILSSRNTNGEWFEDEDDTLVNDFTSFMDVYGGTMYQFDNTKVDKKDDIDSRLRVIAKEIGRTTLIRRYLGTDYEVTLTEDGYLEFMGEKFTTPNTCYNNGIVKHVKGVKGGSGTNGLNQFIVKETNQNLEKLHKDEIMFFVDGERVQKNFDYEYITETTKLGVESVGEDEMCNSEFIKRNVEEFPVNILSNYRSSIKQVGNVHVLTWGNKEHKKKVIDSISKQGKLQNKIEVV